MQENRIGHLHAHTSLQRNGQTSSSGRVRDREHSEKYGSVIDQVQVSGRFMRERLFVSHDAQANKLLKGRETSDETKSDRLP